AGRWPSGWGGRSGAWLRSIDSSRAIPRRPPSSSPTVPDVSGADLALLGVGALTDLLHRREVSSEEVVRACLARIESLNPKLAAFITVSTEAALRTARRADGELARGRFRGPLHGVPFAVKDAFWTKGVRTTNGSRLFEDFVPAEDATVVARMRAAGAVLLGKLNMMELGFGPTLRPP